MRSTVSEKGQVTIPKKLRERLGLHAGVILEFHDERGRLVATKAQTRHPVDAVYGVLDTDQSSDQIVDRLRGRPDAT